MTSIDYAAELERELAELDERRRAAAVSRASRRTKSGSSVVFSFRLGPDEVVELERRAMATNMPPTTLARQFVRAGLDGSPDATVPELVDRLARDLAALRRALGDGSGS